MTMVSGLIDILSTSRASDLEHKTTMTKKKKKEEEEQEITNRHNAAGINTGEKRVKPNKRHTVTNEEKKRKEFERRGSSITHRSCAVLMGGISISALMGRNESRLVADYGRRSFTSSSSSSSDSDVGSKVVEQYDSEQTRQFYKTVMGGGGNDIHFGVFKSADEGVREAAANTTELMLDLMQWIKPVVPNAAQVLDLGSGHGGATHTMVQRFGTQNLCFNIGSEQNDMNLKTCAKLGIEGNVSCHRGDFNLGLPEEWSDRFDYVYSCEVLCHAADKPALLAEIRRVLKPGGVLVFSDIMGADGVSEEVLRPFTDRNTTTVMGRPSEYRYQLKEAALREVCYVDMSPNLEEFFGLMLKQVEDNYDNLLKEGLTDEYLQNWINSLSDRVNVVVTSHVYCYGVVIIL
mmetsp:Transcript_12213/g.20241  ORF Transcript_12213/g.20241 Transcript_12213/m.20241 type:complete len:404 (-) Transcript_12213:659-1870(-)